MGAINLDAESFQTFCSTPFWDGNLTWNSSWPQMTECFQHVALVGGPCAVLWVLSFFYLLSLLTSPDNVLPPSRLHTFKMVASTLLALVTLFEVSNRFLEHGGSLDDVTAVPLTADLMAPALLFLSVALTAVIMQLEMKKGVRSSVVLVLFWLMLAMGQTVPLYTVYFTESYLTQPLEAVVVFTKFNVIISLLLLNCMAERPDITVPPGRTKKPCPDPYEPLWSRMTFHWMQGILNKGSMGELTDADIVDLLPSEHSENVVPVFRKPWIQEVEKAKRKIKTEGEVTVEEDNEALLERLLEEGREEKKKRRMHQRTKSMEFHRNSRDFKRSKSEFHERKESDALLNGHTEKVSGEEEEEKKKKEEVKEKSKARIKPSLLLALAKAFGLQFFLRNVINLLECVFGLIDPVIFGLFLKFMDDPSAPYWYGFLLCAVMMSCKMLQMFASVRSHFLNHCFAVRIKSSLCNTIFKKALTMDTESRQESTVGQAVNIFSIDVNHICHAFTWMVPEMILIPVRITMALFMLYKLLGPSMLLSVGLLAAMIPINTYVARKLNKLHKEVMDMKDDRLKILTEVINGVKVLKMYAWEPSFLRKVNDARNKELDVMSWAAFWDTAMHFYWCVAPYMITVSLFVSYVYSSEDHYLAPSTAFVAISLVDTMRGNMGTVPHIISHFVKTMVSFGRVNDFLARTDLEDNVGTDSDDVISVKGGFFSWSSTAPPTLKNINLSVKKGSLVAVVGTVGCGKSSLISACLGEMKTLKGKLRVKGSVAYVPQQAWIQHASLKDNVLFGGQMDRKLYDQCLDNCALRPDLDTMPAGENTEIGEKGINLSGGQKQRVSLARAVYAQSDVYMFDDPLSAVDCHVGSHIFDKVIGHQGMLAGKTRVLVTHGVQWLPKVDQIIVVRHGRVSEVGSYDELLSHNGPFAKFLRSYFAHGSESNPEVEKMKLEILQRLESLPREKSVKNDDSDLSTESSSSDNESIIQELLRSASMEQQQEQDSGQGTDESSDKDEVEKKKEEEKKEEEKKDDGKLVEDEDTKVQAVQWTTMLDFAKGLGYRWVFLLMGIFAVQQTAERLGDLTLSQWTDDPQLGNLTALPSDSEERIRLNKYYVGLFIGFGIKHAITTMSFKIILLMRKLITARKLHNNMLSRVLHAPMAFFDTTPVGRIVNRFSSDLNAMDSDLLHTMEWMMYACFGMVMKLIIVCYTLPSLVFLILPVAVIFRYMQGRFSPTMRSLERLRTKAKSPIYSFFSETLNGTAVVRAFGAQERFTKEFQNRYDHFNAVEFTWGNINKWLDVRMQSTASLVLGTVVMTAILFKGTLTAGMVGLAITMAMDVVGTLHGFAHMFSWVQTHLISVDRVKEYSEMKIEAEWRKEETAPKPSWPEQGEVKIHDLALRYREGMELVLKGVSVNIKAGEKVGIVGRTGAGKSSLTLALFRMVEPVRGKVTIDDLSIGDLGLHDLRSRLTILPQDPVIFAGSMRMNLDPFAHYSDEELWESLKHAHLSDFVSGLDKKLDHECGEGGENLSVGQRQLLCLARTLLHKTKVLVLDEATAAVDMETDDLIQRTIRSQFSECTVLTIAHRLNTVIDYDKILVLDKGTVKEFDAPQTLMDNPDSVFHDMVKKAGLLPKKS